MGKSGVAKLFRNGRSQAVRLPQEFRFEGDAVRVRRVPEGILLEPLIADTAKWFAAMDRLGGDPFYELWYGVAQSVQTKRIRSV